MFIKGNGVVYYAVTAGGGILARRWSAVGKPPITHLSGELCKQFFKINVVITVLK